MSVEENKAVVGRLVDIINQKNLDEFYECVAPECVFHMAVSDATAQHYLQVMKTMVQSIIPDLQVTIEDIFAEGDRVAARNTWGGTHKGELRGVPPSGNRIEMTQNCIYMIINGKIAEIWQEQNELSLMQQLGALPEGGR